MAGLSLWVRREWSRRWLGLVGLAALIALVGALTLALVGGVRRTATAFERLKESTNFPEVGVDLRAAENPTEAQFVALPTADELANQITSVDGVQGVLTLTYVGATADRDGSYFGGALGASRGEAPTDRVVTGRLPAADAPDEIAVNETAMELWGAEVGQPLTIHTLGRDQMLTFIGLDPQPGHGPTIPMRVVGVVRGVEEISDVPEPYFMAGPGFVDRWADEVAMVTGNSLVKVDPARVDAIVDDLNATISPSFEAGRMTDQDDFSSRVNDTISVEVTVLALFALAAALAGLVVVGQALARSVGGSGADHGSLAALGVTPRQAAVGLALTVAPAIALGALGSVVVAVALSPLFPRGLARAADPDLGLRIDPFVLGLGVAALLLVFAGLTVLVSSRAVRRGEWHDMTTGGRGGVVARVASAFPPVVSLGTRFALQPERGRVIGGLAGVVGAAVLVAGLVGVATVERSRAELLTDGRLFGADWDLELNLEDGELDRDAVVQALVDDPGTEAVGTRAVLMGNDGAVEVRGPAGSTTADPTAFVAHKGAFPPIVSAGRPPGPGEVAIGEHIARRLDVSIGDTVVAAGFSGDVPLRVTGLAVNPGHDDLDRGFMVIPDTLQQMVQRDCPTDEDDFACLIAEEGVAVNLRNGTSSGDVQQRLADVVPGLVPTARPSVVDNLAQIGTSPWLLAGFLVLIGGAGLAHALLVGTRHRRRDLAVVRALGLGPRQARQIIEWQAVVMGGLGAVVGALVGLVLGRFVWQRVAEGVGALVQVTLPPAMLLIAPAAAVLLALGLSLFTGRRASGLRPAVVLRSE